MGIIWKSTMPLLSTLAALVIIVHSAEEEMNRSHRTDLRPRQLDTASYEQPWKAIDVVPFHQPTRAEGWTESPDEVPIRRRPVRKRKRRPLSYPDTAPQERHQESLQGGYANFNEQAADPSKRRRKRPEHMNYYLTEQPPMADDVKQRRLGLRKKKRPDYDEQLASPPDYEPLEIKYDQKYEINKPFDDAYFETERNTKITPKTETHTTDQFQYAEDAFNREFIHEAEESESILSLEDNLAVIKKITSSEPTTQRPINAKSTTKNDKDIMTTINDQKVQKLKLGIIFNGKVHSYLPLSIPPEDLKYDHNKVPATHAPLMINMIDNTDYNGKEISKMVLPIQKPKNASDSNATWKKNKQRNKDGNYGHNSPYSIKEDKVKMKSYEKNLDNTRKGMNNKSFTKPIKDSSYSHHSPNNIMTDDVNLKNNGSNLSNTGKEIDNISSKMLLVPSGTLVDTSYSDGLAHNVIKPSVDYVYKESNAENCTTLALKSFNPHIISNGNTSKADQNMYENKSTPKVKSKSFSKNKAINYYRVNNKDVSNQKPHDIQLSTTTQTFLLGYRISKNLTDKINKLEGSNLKPTPAKVPISNTEMYGSLMDIDNDNKNIHSIIFPISLTKHIAFDCLLKDKIKTSNVVSEIGVSDAETSPTLSIFTEEGEKVTETENSGYKLVEEILGNKAKEVILLELLNGVAEMNNKINIIKHSRKYLMNGDHPKKRIIRNKRIAKLNAFIPALQEENNDKELISRELQESGVLDPIMLKQLLKRSNGSSLSEILQQHNLSLSDLLQGRNEAISVLNARATYEPRHSSDTSLDSNSQLNGAESKYTIRRQTSSKQRIPPAGSSSDEDAKGSISNTDNEEPVTSKDDTETEKQSKITTKRRFPTAIRRKLRMRPTLNSTLKAQLSRDLIALSARKYSHNNKNVTKSREWKDIVPMMPDRSKTEDDEKSKEEVTETEPITTDAPVDTTTSGLRVSNTSFSLSEGTDVKENEVVNLAVTTTEATTTITIEVLPDEIMSEIEKPKITPILRPSNNNSTLRRQAFNNRLKRKRLKQKSTTTENPSDDLMKNFLGMANLVSASQFIERTQKPLTTFKMDTTEFATELEDFLTTQTPAIVDSGVRSTSRLTTSTTARSLPQTSSTSTTEQTAKFEIQEILNDKMTKERLAKILRERNMTLNELVNHRERGSSHVHLADIFHNASKEPNPPEPFLTKSSIEPISKETYPLRAILEANTYETTTRTTSSQADQKNIQIPVVMDFKNNVNENGESMGIMSLFNKLTENEVTIDKAEIQKDSNGTPYVSSIISVNASNTNDSNDTRESRVLSDTEDWEELLTFMKSHNISTFEEDLQTLDKDTDKESVEDLDGDDLMILDSLQRLSNLESNIVSSSEERRETLSEKPGILNKLPNNTKSVAIATASILGLAAILFLLTYTAFKWKQQRNKLRKKESFCDGPIPSPVFENRKGHKNNCSSRSISPMISNTNIYMSTLESNGKESPDYMWNSLRKPFQ